MSNDSNALSVTRRRPTSDSASRLRTAASHVRTLRPPRGCAVIRLLYERRSRLQPRDCPYATLMVRRPLGRRRAMLSRTGSALPLQNDVLVRHRCGVESPASTRARDATAKATEMIGGAAETSWLLVVDRFECPDSAAHQHATDPPRRRQGQTPKRERPLPRRSGGAVLRDEALLLRHTPQARQPPTGDQAEGAAKEEAAGAERRHTSTVSARSKRVKREWRISAAHKLTGDQRDERACRDSHSCVLSAGSTRGECDPALTLAEL
jgi:hypothetical protein